MTFAFLVSVFGALFTGRYFSFSCLCAKKQGTNGTARAGGAGSLDDLKELASTSRVND